MNHHLRLMSVYSAEAERLKTQKSLVLRLHGKDNNFWKVQVVASDWFVTSSEYSQVVEDEVKVLPKTEEKEDNTLSQAAELIYSLLKTTQVIY